MVSGAEGIARKAKTGKAKKEVEKVGRWEGEKRVWCIKHGAKSIAHGAWRSAVWPIRYA
jgi:hypothetical protein